MFTGLIFVAIGLPGFYFSYNGYKVVENIKKINDNTSKYQTLFGFSGTFNYDKLRSRLAKGTICFDWVIDKVIENVKKRKAAV